MDWAHTTEILQVPGELNGRPTDAHFVLVKSRGPTGVDAHAIERQAQ